jgi:tetratricopeptide (TPR) repeat protein
MRGSEDIQIVRRAPRRARLWGLAGVTALAATLWLLFIPRDKPEIVTLAVIEPLPVRLNRGEADSGQFHEARIRGLELYAGADYAGARDALQRAVELEPDNDEVNLYLGSAELLVGNESRAQPPLRTAARTTASPQVREEALWQLANAHLAAGERSEAVSVLREVVSQDRRHREQAERLLGELEK